MSKQYSVLYTPEAYHDLGDIYSYIAFVLKEKGTASNLVKRIRKEIASLGAFPERYSSVEWEPWASMGIRKMPVERYVVYYCADMERKAVTIIRIFYGGRDVEGIITAKSD